ncbi:unnamed protein product [Sphagnum balticum]
MESSNKSYWIGEDGKRRAIIAGLAGIAGVSVQSVILSWAANVVDHQTETGDKFYKIVKDFLGRGGFKRLYRGEFKRFRYMGLARCGDLVCNHTILGIFERKGLGAIPIFIQTAASWSAAALWRMLILPVDLFHNIKASKRISAMRLLLKLNYKRYKRLQSDIIPLYSWLVVQNYLLAYTPKITFREDITKSLVRNTLIGFASMIAFDVFKAIQQVLLKNIWRSKHPYPLRFGPAFLRGIYGVVFCNVTQLTIQNSPF